MRPRPSPARRGFTLVELLVYVGLVTMGLLFVGSIELTAVRTVSLQQALIDIHGEAHELLGRLRRDVEAARRVEVGEAGEELRVERLDGRRVVYTPGLRVEEGPDGAERRERYGLLDSWDVTLRGREGGAGARVDVEATFVAETRQGDVRRVRRRTAATRREVARD